jgi:CHAD domain-containing protein
MTPPPVRLRAPGTQRPDLAEVVARLEPSFRVHVGPRTDVRRTSLDTFDRRLAAARLRLVHQVPGAGRRNGVLLLEAPTGEELVADADGLAAPLMAADLPPGRLRDAVAPSMGIRALVADAEHRRRVRRAELRNDDDKLVGVLDLDEPAGASSEDPTEVTVRPLRGYDREARRAVRALRRCGLVVDDSDQATRVVKVSPPDFSPSTPATELLAQVFGGFLATMRANFDGLVDDVDTEFLHDYRVAVRRTRSTLKLSRTALPGGMAARWEPEFKWLGDLTTPVRDLDVYELDLPTMSSWLVGASPADLAPFETHLRRRRTKERRALLRGLRSARAARLLTDWDNALEELSGSDASDVPTARDLAAKSIRRAGRRVLRDGQRVHADSPAEDLHSLRKRCKELRYALEVFAPVVDATDRKRLVTDLKVLQDVLGRFQDTEVQRTALRGFATEMMSDGTPAEAVLAMGELIGHLDTAQDDARREFDDAFARLARPGNQQRLSRLGGRA